ncbi:hypothetical protein KC19_10G107200 [Ceratodon purpureus]|uniref:C2 domain-containing protein n=1 Tax=Ceratodon purpureus TaxID=3225 RepID=A0A8T0GLN3_CERPU|nr:hypothetical protein KC19_10G107200 [Ceratodon purpureus]
MFEAHVLHLLRLYLGEYVRGLSVEALKISVWQGDVVLRDLQLKAEALNALNLPITVKAGFLGSVTLKVPWNRLGKDPVIVLLDRIFILAEPLKDDRTFTKEDKERWYEAKRRKCEEAELAMFEAKDHKTAGPQESDTTSNTWFSSLIATIVGNLKISITNLHIRYEDTVSNPGRPFVSGVTLATLAAVTIDESGHETFVTSGALERLRKSVRLERLAVYHDSGSTPWYLEKAWEEMTPDEWEEVFMEGIKTDPSPDKSLSKWATGRQYLLHPVGGLMTYNRRGKREKRKPEVPFQEATLVLEPVSLTVSEAQYCDGMKLLEGVSTYRTRLQYSHFRPQASVSEDSRAWWLYACQAVLQQHSRVWYRLQWSSIADACRKRRKYVQLYASCLNQGFKVNNQEIKDIEKDLDIEVILLWRLLAHARAESVKSKEAAVERERIRKSSWWSFGWGSANSAEASTPSTAPDDSPTPISPTPSTDAPGQLTKEEWSKINQLLSFQPGEDVLNVSKSDGPNMMQISLDVNIRQGSARILDCENKEILCGTFENLQVGIRVYPKTLACEGKLQFYGLSAPEGMLIESVSREGRDYAMSATYVQAPFDENLDWKLAATMSPCHVKVWKISFERFLHFLKSSQALSPGVALETAAVLQNKLEEVTRRAQEQLQQALEQQSRFSIYLDLDAPKISIPAKTSKSDEDDTQLLLDLGHFTLHTATDNNRDVDVAKSDMYSRFSISGKEISAFVVDRDFEWSEVASLSSASPLSGDMSQDAETDVYKSRHSGILPVLDPCGMSLVLDQIRVQHPNYPSTRLAIKVPRLGIHFSPARYHRLMSVLSALEGGDNVADDSPETEVAVPWQLADYSSDARLLVWGGIGSTVAEWQTCRAILAGTYLYILESDSAHTYQRCISVTGKQVVEVPSESIGNFENVVAICHRGVEIQKVVESSSALILQLKNEELKAAWQYYLALATYKAPAPLLSMPSESSDEDEDDHDDEKEVGKGKEELQSIEPAKQPQLFVMGFLQELQISLSNTTNTGASTLGDERLILELQAHGGKVDVLQRQYDTSITMKVHSLRIEDKLQGHVAPSCRYLLRSSLSADAGVDDMETSPAEKSSPKGMEEEEEQEVFDDALAEFGVPSSPSSSEQGSFHRLFSLGRSDLTPSQEKSLRHWELELMNLGKEGTVQDLWVDGADEEVSDFANMRLIIRQTDSPDYDDTDVQMTIRMATLDFFCNRPTVVALIEFGSQLSDSSENPPTPPAKVLEESDTKENPEAAVARDVVKGLLGRGKSRVVFRLKLDMESARISINKEDGSQLGMLAQDDFRFELKVYPGSLTISGTLGNLRVCDMLLGADHQWGWLCDIRDPGAGSLVELEFQSYNKDEDDYQGYDYSLSGKLSAVRIVFLYRFIQEITAYFVALATPQTSQVVSVVDKVGGTEKLIQQSDIGGSTAVKLDFSLDTPTIIMPRCSDSQEFMQLDLGHLEVHNSFEWHGGDKDVASAVHLDVLHAELTGINMVVGISGQPGKPMLRETKGLHVTVQRALRDLFKKVPEIGIDVQVPLLSGVMTHKEYLVITDCASTNMSEVPNLPPTFRETAKMSEISDEEKMSLETAGESEDDKATTISSNFDSDTDALVYTKIRVNVDVRQVELDLYVGLESETPLARLEIQKFWLSYCNSSANNMDILITLSKLSVLDQRFDTRPEMRLMLGSLADVERSGGPSFPVRTSVEDESANDSSPELTMLVLDLRFKPDSQAFVIRVQRPRLLVVVDFLLAVGEFFVPSLGKDSSENDSENSQNGTEILDEHVRLATPLHQQEEDTIVLSCERQLIAEAYDVDEFIYDGCGKTLLLDVKDDENGPTSLEPLIVIGPGKKLRFRNIRIENGFWLSECVHLSSDSAYTASLDDGVILEGMDGNSSGRISIQAAPHKDSLLSAGGSSIKKSSEEQKATGSNYVLDIQAVAPELTFYDSSKWPAGSPRRERVLRANLDCYIMIASKGNDKWIKGVVKGLTVEGGSGLVVVDPLDASAEYSCVQEKITLAAGVSDISTRLTFNVLSLILRFQEDALSTFKLGGAPALARCTHFDRIWVNATGDNITQQVAIWRPRAPSGYLIMGDCATSGMAPPTQAVMAISSTSKFAQKPVRFDLLWSTRGDTEPGVRADADRDDIDSEHCCVWMPVAPEGYISLGCVAERGLSPPSLSSVRCIRSDMVTSGALSDCIYYCPPDDGGRYKNGCSIWRMENAAGSFYAHSSTTPPSRPLTRDLSETLLRTVSHIVTGMDRPETNADSSPSQGSLRRLPSVNSRVDSMASGRHTTGRYLITTPQFERMWWDRGSEVRPPASIWRPVAPAGYAIVGDCLVRGLEPPGVGVALRDDDTGRLAKPLRYLQRMHTTGRGLEDVVVWFPVAPTGYVAVGCVVSKTQQMPSLDLVRCLRIDLVTQSRLSKPAVWSLASERSPTSVWSMSGARGGYSCSMWRVENQANTFFARPDLKCPPARMAYALADGKKRARDKLSAEIKIGRISATVFDDVGGLMTPLVNTTITNINLAAHGRLEAMSAVILTNMAASTFNTQLECWEPFIEPFEGIFKYESYDVDSEAPFKVGKRIRITAANAVNVNVTSAGLETLVESVMSWRKQTESEEQARMSLEMEGSDYREPDHDTLNCALEEDELEKILVQNTLGCDLYVRRFVDNFEQVECLSKNSNHLVHLPPARFPDIFVDATDSRLPRHFAAIHVSEARELHVNGDGNDQDFMCALKLATTKSTDELRTIPQSARSRCVRPTAVIQGSECLLAEAKWNEVFIFELPQKGTAALEVLITNQAARGGKGEAVGVVSIPIDKNTEGNASQPSRLWNVVRRSLKQGPVASSPAIENKVYSLLQPRKMNGPDDHLARKKSWGLITVSMYFFSTKTDKQEKMADSDSKDDFKGADIGLWLAVGPQGPWTGLRSILPATTVPKEIGRRPLAVEVSVQQNQKCLKVRSLITISNNTDMALDVCQCPFRLLNTPDGSTKTLESKLSTVDEEIFENQRYQPLGGWGSKWPGHMLPGDPNRWSNRDYSNTSPEFTEPPLPPGWVWSTDWSVDRNSYVDEEGWFYGPDFQSLKGLPSSSKASRKSMFDFARRRRFVKQRKCIPETQHMHSRQMVGVVQPGDSIPLPLAGSDSKTDMCVQFRPHSDSSLYSWGRAISDLISQSRTQSSNEGGSTIPARQTKSNLPVSALPLKELEKTEEILLSRVLEGGRNNSLCWLNVDVDATLLYNEVNNPIPDWRITVNAPVKLENRLPCSAAYIIWEKPRATGDLIKQQDGIVSAGGSVYIYSVDVRRPVYLTWLAQGGWRSEKEIIPISDPSMEDIPTGFWMAHQGSGRRLRVSLEHDFGGSSAAAKIVRLFVPYWLRNDACLPLAYRLVEIEPNNDSTGDLTWLSRAAKAAKQAARRPNHSGAKHASQLHRVVGYFEKVEDMTGTPVMLSLQAYSDRIGGLSLSSRSEDGLLSPRLGLSIAIANSNIFKRALSFRDFESNMERVNLNAEDDGGSYHKLSAFLDMSSDRTKVIHVQPHTLFVNRLGRRLSLRQCHTRHEELFYPNDPPKPILWQSTEELELLEVNVDGYKWSHPFSVDSEGIFHIELEAEQSGPGLVIRGEVRNGVKDSRYFVVFRLAARQSPYRLENRSTVLPIKFRQAGSDHSSWKVLLPGSSASFAWEDLLRDHLLEVLPEGYDSQIAIEYRLDELFDYQPFPSIRGGVAAPLRATVMSEGFTKVFRVADYTSNTDNTSMVVAGVPTTPRSLAPEFHNLENQFHTSIELAEFGLSIVDHTPEELLYVSIQNLVLSYATGLGSGTNRLKIRVDSLQIDNQLPLTPYPVLFMLQESQAHPDFLLKCTITTQDNGVLDYFFYPYIGIQGPNVPNVSFLVNIHEPIIWRLHEMFQHVDLGRLSSSKTTAVAIDPIIRVGLLHTTEIRLKVTLAMAPAQRPRGMLGFWGTLITSLGNTHEMPIRITPRVHEDVSMRQSAMWAAAFGSLRNDLMSQPLQLLSGVDILGNTSSALGNMSKGVAALSMDKKFIRGRQKQANVEDLGEGIREGGEAFAKGLFRGLTGIVTKPFEGAQKSGVEGFLQGVGKGVIGVGIQPLSGALDLLSKTTEGANATRMKLTAAITFEQQALRRRLPRVIGGDKVLRLYDEYKARGQVLMQLAERGTMFGPVDFFRVRGKFAMSDAYEDHFNLPKGRTLTITHRRVILLQHPTSLIQQKKPDLLKEPCTITWDVTWDDLRTMELAYGNEESRQMPPSRLIIRVKGNEPRNKDTAFVVKCHPGTKQAIEIRNAIQQAYNTYGPGRSSNATQGLLKKSSARKPYAGAGAGAASGAALGLLAGPAAPIAVPVMATFGALIGSASQAMLDMPQVSQVPSKTQELLGTSQHAGTSTESVHIGRLISDFELLWWDKVLLTNVDFLGLLLPASREV